MQNIEINDKTIIQDINYNMFNILGTEGFTLYCYFLTNKNIDHNCQTTINMIKRFFDDNTDSNIKLIYGGSKKCKVSNFKTTKIIFKYINILIENHIIKDGGNEISSSLNNPFIVIPETFDNSVSFKNSLNEIYLKSITKIGCIGWSLFCILNILKHNNGSEFVSPTEKFLASIIKKDVKTVRVYLQLLKEYKLINIEQQKPLYLGKDSHGHDCLDFVPNKYFICEEIPEFITSQEKLIIKHNKDEGFLYIITTNNIEYKIGKTKDFNKRLGEYTLLPYLPKLILLIKVKNYSKCEEKLQAKYITKRLRGEWFKLDKSDVKYITSTNYISELENNFIENVDINSVKII